MPEATNARLPIVDVSATAHPLCELNELLYLPIGRLVWTVCPDDVVGPVRFLAGRPLGSEALSGFLQRQPALAHAIDLHLLGTRSDDHAIEIAGTARFEQERDVDHRHPRVAHELKCAKARRDRP